jgi:hypothetical protein
MRSPTSDGPARAGLQPGKDVAVVHDAHLPRHARHDEHRRIAHLSPNAGGGPAGVLDRLATRGEHGLHGVGRRHGAAPLGEERPDLLEVALLQDQPDAQDGRQRLAGQVVGGGAQPARDQHQVRQLRRATDLPLERLYVVSHRDVRDDLHADFGQPLRQPGGVGVHGLAERQFVAHAEDDGVHSDQSNRCGAKEKGGANGR